MAGVVADRVVVELEARLGRYEADVARAERKFDQSMGEIQQSASRTERLVQRAMGGMAAALSGVSVLALARGFLALADEAKNLDAQLRLATSQTGNFGKATEDVRRIAETTRSGLTETAALYGNFVRSGRELGLSQVEAAKATETFAKTLKISGAGAAEAGSATLQFGQALASGVLRGDEFNSIMEASPRLARLLADSLDVPVGRLRAMAEEGELTADKLTRALTETRFTETIDAEFRELPVTFDQAMTQVHNAAIITFGAFDRGGEFSTMLANFISDGTEGFTNLEQSAERMGINARANISGLASAFSPVISAAKELAGLMARIGGSQFEWKGIDIGRDIQKSLEDVDRFTNWYIKPENTMYGVFAKSVGVTTGTNFAGLNKKGAKSTRQGLTDKQRDRKLDSYFGSMWRDGRLFEEGNPYGKPVKRAPAYIPPAKEKKGPKGPSAETLAKRAEAAALAAERRQQQFDNESANLDRDIIDARRALSNSAAIRAELELQDIETARAKYADNVDSLVKQKRYTAEQAAALKAKNNERASVERQVVQNREAERLADQALTIAQADLRDAQEIEGLNGQLAETRQQRRDSELRLLDLQYREEKMRLERIRDDEKLDRAVRDQAGRSLGALETTRGQRQEAIERDTASPMQRYRREVGDVGRNINDSLEQVQVDGLEALTDGFSDMIMGAKSFGDVMKNVANQVIAALVRIAIQQAVVAAFGGGGGGGGLGSLFGGFFADGGTPPIGKVSVVGERGPELFVPKQAGVIVPNHALRPASSGTTVISSPKFDLRGVVMTREVYADMQRISQANAAQAAAAMGKGVLQAVPSRMAQFQTDGT